MLIARPSPVTSYTTVCVWPGAVVSVVGGVVGSDGSGSTGRVGVRDVVVGLGADVLGSGIDGTGATTVCCRELLAMTSAMTRPTTVSTATAARIHSHSGDLRSFGGSGGSPGGN